MNHDLSERPMIGAVNPVLAPAQWLEVHPMVGNALMEGLSRLGTSVTW